MYHSNISFDDKNSLFKMRNLDAHFSCQDASLVLQCFYGLLVCGQYIACYYTEHISPGALLPDRALLPHKRRTARKMYLVRAKTAQRIQGKYQHSSSTNRGEELHLTGLTRSKNHRVRNRQQHYFTCTEHLSCTLHANLHRERCTVIGPDFARTFLKQISR